MHVRYRLDAALILRESFFARKLYVNITAVIARKVYLMRKGCRAAVHRLFCRQPFKSLKVKPHRAR